MSFVIYSEYLKHIFEYIENHDNNYTKVSELRITNEFFSISWSLFGQVNHRKSYVFVGLAIFCIYNEILRREQINSYSFYYEKCRVNIDDGIKQQFRSAYEVLCYIPRNSVKEQKHQAVYDRIKEKFNSTIRSHFPITSEDYNEFIDFTNRWLFEKDLNIQIKLPKYNSELKYRLDQFGCYEIYEKMMKLYNGINNHNQDSLKDLDEFLEEYYFNRN